MVNNSAENPEDFGNNEQPNLPVQPSQPNEPKQRFSLLEVIQYGFNGVFVNSSVWLVLSVCVVFALLSLVVFSIAMGLSNYDPAGVAPSATQTNPGWMIFFFITFMVMFLFISVFYCATALKQTREQPVTLQTLFQGIPYGVAVPVVLIRFLVYVVLQSIPYFVTGVGVVGLLGTLIAFASVFIDPFLTYAPFFALDGKDGVVGSIKRGIAFGKEHYGFLILYTLISATMIGVSALMCYLPLIVVLPAVILGQAAIYEQLAHGRALSIQR